MAEQTRTFKIEDLVLPAVGELQFDQASLASGGDTVKVTLVARTNSVVKSWFGGMVHDLKGMFCKNEVPLDWCHSDELIGYLDDFVVSDTEIKCEGAVCSTQPGDMASKIISKAHAKIPFESSIFFGGQGLVVEEIPEEKEVSVNGGTFMGPGVVFREWPMRRVALCPSGADNQTSATFKMADCKDSYSAVVLTNEKEPNMADDAKTAELEAKAKELEEKEKELEETIEEFEEAAETPNLISSDGVAGAEFITAFGDKGAVWFVEGKTFKEATILHIAKLEERVKAAEDKLAALKQEAGGDEPVEFEDGEDDDKGVVSKKIEKLTNVVGGNLAPLAASIDEQLARKK